MRNHDTPDILYVKIYCPVCGWKGLIVEAEPDVDGDGNLSCPLCLSQIVVIDQWA